MKKKFHFKENGKKICELSKQNVDQKIKQNEKEREEENKIIQVKYDNKNKELQKLLFEIMDENGDLTLDEEEFSKYLESDDNIFNAKETEETNPSGNSSSYKTTKDSSYKYDQLLKISL